MQRFGRVGCFEALIPERQDCSATELPDLCGFRHETSHRGFVMTSHGCHTLESLHLQRQDPCSTNKLEHSTYWFVYSSRFQTDFHPPHSVFMSAFPGSALIWRAVIGARCLETSACSRSGPPIKLRFSPKRAQSHQNPHCTEFIAQQLRKPISPSGDETGRVASTSSRRVRIGAVLGTEPFLERGVLVFRNPASVSGP